MALVNQTLKLEITPGGVPPKLHVTEYDENMQVVAQLFQRGQYYEIPSGTTAKVEGTLAGHPFSADATVDGSNVTFELTKGMTAYAGRAWTKIKLTKDSKPVSTCGFWLECDRAGVEAETVIGADGFQEQINQAVAEYIEDSGLIIDSTLSIQGAAADAKATGDAISALSEEIATLPTTGGQPKPVASAADMTDTETIYLYLGSEDGYEYGYIYVYTNGVWTNTGLYGKGQDGATAEITVVETDSGITITVNGNSYIVKNGTATDAQVEAAVNSWLKAHPEATTTVQDGSITQAKMAFPAVEGKRSPNLIDPDGLIGARFTSVSGGRQTFGESNFYYSYWRMTGYIDVSAHVGEQVWVHNVQGYCFYDSDKTAIANSGYFSTSESGPGETVGVTVPDGASYFVVAMFNATGLVYTANFGTEFAPYVPYGQINLKDGSVTAANISGALPLSKIDTTDLIMPQIGMNLIDKTKMVKDMWVNKYGVPVSTAASLENWHVDGVKVKGGTTYLAYCARIVFYDAYGNVCGVDDTGDLSKYRQVTAPAGATTCSVNGSGYMDCLPNMVHQEFLVEGTILPIRIVNEMYYSENSLDSTCIYKSVLHRMADCWDYTTKTTIGLCGDSNTIGIKGNGNTTQNPNCWANLFTAEVSRKLSGDRYIFPFCDVGVWGCGSYGPHKEEANLTTGSVIKIPFYGTSITMSKGTVNSVPITLSVEIDGEAQDDVTIEAATEYTWSGLSDGPHTLQIVVTSGKNYCVAHFKVQKTVEVINRGISGRNLAQIETDVGTSGDTIDIVCLGTNDRGSGTVLHRDGCLDRWEYTNRKTKIIYVSPIPARDSIETAGAAWGTVPYVESFIAGREAKKNCEYISLYHEMIDYCDRTGTDIATLYVDGLHLNDAGHKVIAKILCRKLGLGDLTETAE